MVSKFQHFCCALRKRSIAVNRELFSSCHEWFLGVELCRRSSEALSVTMLDFPDDALSTVLEDPAWLADAALDFPDDVNETHVAAADALCWGGLLAGNSTICTPGFLPQVGHFKNKICPRCRSEGILIPGDRIRALDQADPAAERSLSNSRNTGLWSLTEDGSNQCRMVNHTAKCSGPRLMIYRRALSAAEPQTTAGQLPVPSHWLEPDRSSVRLFVALGTLRPQSVRCVPSELRAATSGPAASSAPLVPSAPAVVGPSSSSTAVDAADEGAVPDAGHHEQRSGAPRDGSRVEERPSSSPPSSSPPASKRVRMLPPSARVASLEDALAVAGALDDASFRRSHAEQLRTCAKAYPALEPPERRVMHHMWVASTRHALEAVAGELRVARVFGSRSLQGGGLDALGAELPARAKADLALCYACMGDELAWGRLVEAAGKREAGESDLSTCLTGLIDRLTLGASTPATEARMRRAIVTTVKTAVWSTASPCASAR